MNNNLESKYLNMVLNVMHYFSNPALDTEPNNTIIEWIMKEYEREKAEEEE